jgi:hypothetical protein
MLSWFLLFEELQALVPPLSSCVSSVSSSLHIAVILANCVGCVLSCSKFETGYDDPRLGAMFVDR